ncbi:MAG: DUF721 domain-containing protein [Desulfonatronovibrionaceae bacterium]
MNSWLERMDPDGANCMFQHICRSWHEIVGPETARLARPLGRHSTTLILGVQDGIVMQEMHFLGQSIVDAVNQFCGSVFFDKVRAELLKGRTPLDEVAVKPPDVQTRILKPGPLGGLEHKMKKDSPVTRCYQAYVRLFQDE